MFLKNHQCENGRLQWTVRWSPLEGGLGLGVGRVKETFGFHPTSAFFESYKETIFVYHSHSFNLLSVLQGSGREEQGASLTLS